MEAEWDAFQKFADDVKKSVKVENPRGRSAIFESGRNGDLF